MIGTDELELLIDVYRNYGRYTGWALKEMTHEKNSPWSHAYKKGENQVISVNSIKEYFSNLSLETFDINSVKLPIIEAIPKSWDSVEDAFLDKTC